MTRKASFVAGMVVGGGLLAAGALLGGMAKDPDAPAEGTFTTVTAQQLLIVDDKGRTMALVGFDKRGGGFHAYAADEREVAAMGAFDAGGGLVTYNQFGGMSGKMP